MEESSFTGIDSSISQMPGEMPFKSAGSCQIRNLPLAKQLPKRNPRKDDK
jgi:hypothetical protein